MLLYILDICVAFALKDQIQLIKMFEREKNYNKKQKIFTGMFVFMSRQRTIFREGFITLVTKVQALLVWNFRLYWRFRLSPSSRCYFGFDFGFFGWRLNLESKRNGLVRDINLCSTI